MLGWERDVSSSITWERTGSFGRGLEGLGRMESFALQGGASKSGVPPWDCSIFWVSPGTVNLGQRYLLFSHWRKAHSKTNNG